MTKWLRIAPAALALALWASGYPFASIAQGIIPGIDPATGFRMERYKAPTPDAIPGGSLAALDDVRRMAADGKTVFIDVYPPRGGGPDPIDGNWRLTETRDNIAGSVWLPDVGRGHLEAAEEAYFRRNLERLTNGDMSRPLLFYCTADCWQGWNAARRAILWGYGSVFWYPDGSDGWTDAGGELAPAIPVNFLEGGS